MKTADPVFVQKGPSPFIEGRDFRLDIEVAGRTLILRFCGFLNEEFIITKVLERIRAFSPSKPPGPKVVIDLSGLTRMNSLGVREWILFLEQLPHSSLEFSGISEVFLQQGVIVPELLGSRSPLVRSFEAPYFCEQCNQRKLLTLRPAELARNGGALAPPARACEKCNSKLVFDALEEEYFFFLTQKSVA
jgi:hypothetical protein